MLLGAGWPFHLGGITPYLDRTGISERVTGQRFLPRGVASVPAPWQLELFDLSNQETPDPTIPVTAPPSTLSPAPTRLDDEPNCPNDAAKPGKQWSHVLSHLSSTSLTQHDRVVIDALYSVDGYSWIEPCSLEDIAK
jgi:hypothetical protein